MTTGLLQESMAELSAALERAVGASRPIEHNLLKGEFRERRVIAGLRPFIPRRFEMTSGIVVNAAGDYSRQQDIILSDTTRAAPILAAGELGVHPVELIDGSVEVKSVATKDAVTEAVENIRSVKQLASDEMRPFAAVSGAGIGLGETNEKPFGGILFLGSSARLEDLFDAYVSCCSAVPPIDRPNVMTVVEKGSVHRATTQDQELRQIEPIATNGNAAALLPVAGNALLSFYMSMMNVLTRYRPPEFDLVGYVNAAGGLGPHTVTVQHL